MKKLVEVIMLSNPKTLVIALSLFLFSFLGWAQSPEDGKIANGYFRSSYFHLSYPIPPGLIAVDSKTVQSNLGPGSGHHNEFIIFSAKQPSANFGVVILAEKTSPGSAFQKSDDFVDRIQTLWKTGVTNIKRTHFNNKAGIAFSRIDGEAGSQFYSGIVMQANGYLLVFKFNADSPQALSKMTSTMDAIAPTR